MIAGKVSKVSQRDLLCCFLKRRQGGGGEAVQERERERGRGRRRRKRGWLYCDVNGIESARERKKEEDGTNQPAS